VIEVRSAFHAVADPEADEKLAKVALVLALKRRIQALGLTQTEAAARMGIPRPNLARILGDGFDSVTHDRLYALLGALGVGVRVSLVLEAEPHVDVDLGDVTEPSAPAARAVAERPAQTSRSRKRSGHREA
jgi:transcriptional regulator with XRE-family HTH domain